MSKSESSIDRKIADIEKQLASIENLRSNLIAKLETLHNEKKRISNAVPPEPVNQNANKQITQNSPSNDKIALFRSLFRGREDVYARRWENTKTQKSGYAPACKNEWIPGVCDKPRIKCGECPNQAFLPVSDTTIRNHLLGYDLDKHSNNPRKQDFTIGLYPLLADETCRFSCRRF